MIDTEPISVLLVEDNPYDAELTLRALKQQNFANTVTVLKDGAEALDFIFNPTAEQSKPGRKVILLDLKLPKVNGLEVLRKIKSDEKTRMIPVIILTSSQEDRDLSECYKLGANSYIVKPVDFDQFFKAVSQFGFYWLLLNKQPQ